MASRRMANIYICDFHYLKKFYTRHRKGVCGWIWNGFDQIKKMSWMKQKINKQNLWSACGVIMFSNFFNIMLRKHELIYGGQREWWILFWKMCLFFSTCFKVFSAAVSPLAHKTKISQSLQPNIATLRINRNRYASSFFIHSFKNIYLFTWLCWVSVVAWGNAVASFGIFHCGA